MDAVNIESFSCRGLLADFDGGEEGELAHDLLALDEFELGILITGVDLDTGLEVLDRLLGLQNGSIGSSATVVCLCISQI